MELEQITEKEKRWQRCRKTVLDTIYRLLEPIEMQSQQELQLELQNLDQQNWDDVEEERFLGDICGYILCKNVLENNSNRKRKVAEFTISTGKVIDMRRRRRFCSDRCCEASEIVKLQLPEEPIWTVGPEKRPHFGIKFPVLTELRGISGKEVDLKRWKEVCAVRADNDAKFASLSVQEFCQNIHQLRLLNSDDDEKEVVAMGEDNRDAVVEPSTSTTTSILRQFVYEHSGEGSSFSSTTATKTAGGGVVVSQKRVVTNNNHHPENPDLSSNKPIAAAAAESEEEKLERIRRRHFEKSSAGKFVIKKHGAPKVVEAQPLRSKENLAAETKVNLKGGRNGEEETGKMKKVVDLNFLETNLKSWFDERFNQRMLQQSYVSRKQCALTADDDNITICAAMPLIDSLSQQTQRQRIVLEKLSKVLPAMNISRSLALDPIRKVLAECSLSAENILLVQRSSLECQLAVCVLLWQAAKYEKVLLVVGDDSSSSSSTTLKNVVEKFVQENLNPELQNWFLEFVENLLVDR